MTSKVFLKRIQPACFFTCVMVFVGIHGAFAQLSPPSLRCISVEPSGAVSLTWIASPDTGSNFGGYFIYGSPSVNGPFSLYDSVKVHSLQSFTITSINASNFSFYFFIKTREGCCNTFSIPSDTLRTMRLVATPLSNEQVRLTWNLIRNPLPGTAASNHTVLKELSPGTYSTFRLTPDTFTFDTNYFCDKIINFKVQLEDASGCQSVSSIDAERFRDTQGPAATNLDSISIDPATGNVVITWEPDTVADTQGYVIYEFNGASYDSIGSVAGINTLLFTFSSSLSNAASLSEIFSVAAYDSCKNLSPVAQNHKTIFLEAEIYKCENSARLEWTPYLNFAGGLSRYEIWIRENGGPWVIDGSTLSNILSYDLILQTPGANYEVLIHAISNTGKTSSSNVVSIFADIFVQPEFLYVRYASVEGSAVEVRCHTDPSADTKFYHLYRGDSDNGIFSKIATIPFNPSGDISFIDLDARADIASRFYKVAASDSCENEFFSSNIAKTVFLNAEGGSDYLSRLKWNAYLGWDNPVEGYRVLRVINGSITNDQVGGTSADTLMLNEDVSQLSLIDDNFCYVVLAFESPFNSFGFSDSAFSNIQCAPQEPSMFVPNAFTPDGINPVFKPILRFEDPSRYSLLVFNRWGQKVFESTNPSIGWDGYFSGEPAPAGSYLFWVAAKGLNGNEIEKRGLVTLLR
jgi:gliding motility-associated-like protein